MTLNELLALAVTIKNETAVDANSATRIGIVLESIINFFNSKLIDSTEIETILETLLSKANKIALSDIISAPTPADNYEEDDEVYNTQTKLIYKVIVTGGVKSWSTGYSPEAGSIYTLSGSSYIWSNNDLVLPKNLKFKTINGNSILGTGDIVIEGGGGGGTTGIETISVQSIADLDSDIAIGVYEITGALNGLLIVSSEDDQGSSGDTLNTQAYISNKNIIQRQYNLSDFQGYGQWTDYLGNVYTKAQIAQIFANYYTKDEVNTIQNEIFTQVANDATTKVDRVALLSITTAPAVNSSNKHYYNSANKLIYQSIYSSGSYRWDSVGYAPSVGVIYTFGGNNFILKNGELIDAAGSGGVTSYNLLTDKPNLDLKADLEGGLIPARQLPSFVDDMIEILGFYNNASIPDIPDDGYRYYNSTVTRIKIAVDGVWVNDVNSGVPESGKIYVTVATTPYKSYRWSGSNLVRVDDVDLTNYYTKAEIQAAYALKSEIPSTTLTSDIVVNLSGGRTFGKYATGSTIPATGKTIEQVLRDACLEAINPTATVSASGSIPFNSTTGSLTVSMTYVVNNPSATITGFVLSVRRGSGSYTQIYSGTAKASHTHDVATLLGTDNVSNFNYKLVVTDSLGSTVTVTSNSITPASYAAPTCNISTGNPTRELGNVSTAFSGSISISAQNGVSITSRKLQYSLNNSTWIDITTLGSDTVSYTHNDVALVNSTVIYYRLQIDVSVIGVSNISNLALGQVNFAYKQVFGYDASATPSLATILAMGNSALTNSKAKTVTATAGSGLYTYYAYCASAGDLASVIMDGVTPVLGSFTKMTDVTGTNSFGATVTYRIYKSNAPAAFTSNNLVIS